MDLIILCYALVCFASEEIAYRLSFLDDFDPFMGFTQFSSERDTYQFGPIGGGLSTSDIGLISPRSSPEAARCGPEKEIAIEHKGSAGMKECNGPVLSRSLEKINRDEKETVLRLARQQASQALQDPEAARLVLPNSNKDETTEGLKKPKTWRKKEIKTPSIKAVHEPKVTSKKVATKQPKYEKPRKVKHIKARVESPVTYPVTTSVPPSIQPSSGSSSHRAPKPQEPNSMNQIESQPEVQPVEPVEPEKAIVPGLTREDILSLKRAAVRLLIQPYVHLLREKRNLMIDERLVSYFVDSFLTEKSSLDPSSAQTKLEIIAYFQFDVIDIFFPETASLDIRHYYYRYLIENYQYLRFLVYLYPLEMYSILLKRTSLLDDTSDTNRIKVITQILMREFLEHLDKHQIHEDIIHSNFYFTCPRAQYRTISKAYIKTGKTIHALDGLGESFDRTFDLQTETIYVDSTHLQTYLKKSVRLTYLYFMQVDPNFQPIQGCTLTLADLRASSGVILQTLAVDLKIAISTFYQPNYDMDIDVQSFFNTYLGHLHSLYAAFKEKQILVYPWDLLFGIDELFLIWVNADMDNVVTHNTMFARLAMFIGDLDNYRKLRTWIPKGYKPGRHLISIVDKKRGSESLKRQDVAKVVQRFIDMDEFITKTPNLTRRQFLEEFSRLEEEGSDSTDSDSEDTGFF